MKLFRISFSFFALLTLVFCGYQTGSYAQQSGQSEAQSDKSADSRADEPMKDGVKKELTEPAMVLEIKRLEDEKPLYSIELRNVELTDLFRVIAHDYNLNIILDQGITGKITASFTNISLEEALEKIAASGNLVMQKDGGVLKVSPNIITRSFVLKFLEARQIVSSSSASAATSSSGTGSSSTSSSSSSSSSGNSNQGYSSSTSQSLSQGNSASSVSGGRNTIYDLLSPIGKIFLGNDANSIVAIDYPANLEKIASYLSNIDVKPRQVSIEAKVVEVKLQKEHALGVNWSVFGDRGAVLGSTHIGTAALGAMPGKLSQAIDYKNTYYPPGQTASGSEDPFTIAIFDQNINVVMKTLASTLDTNILSAPRVTTINNHEAEIKMTQKLPWAEPTLAVSDSGTVSVSWAVHFEEVGIDLRVTPIINEDGTITMILNPDVSERTSDYSLSVTQSGTTIPYTVPIIDKRTAATKVVVGSGQTLIIGGLIKDKTTTGNSKIPLLGDIPILGYLFKSEKKTKDKTELLIFVSPVVVDAKEMQDSAMIEKYGAGKWYKDDMDRESKMIQDMESKGKVKNSRIEEKAKERSLAMDKRQDDLNKQAASLQEKAESMRLEQEHTAYNEAKKQEALAKEIERKAQEEIRQAKLEAERKLKEADLASKKAVEEEKNKLAAEKKEKERLVLEQKRSEELAQRQAEKDRIEAQRKDQEDSRKLAEVRKLAEQKAKNEQVKLEKQKKDDEARLAREEKEKARQLKLAQEEEARKAAKEKARLEAERKEKARLDAIAKKEWERKATEVEAKLKKQHEQDALSAKKAAEANKKKLAAEQKEKERLAAEQKRKDELALKNYSRQDEMDKALTLSK